MAEKEANPDGILHTKFKNKLRDAYLFEEMEDTEEKKSEEMMKVDEEKSEEMEEETEKVDEK